MRFASFIILLLTGLAYTCWRIWRIVPASPVWKWAAVTAWILCFASIFIHYGLGDRLPLWLAAATYEIGTSWLIAFFYVIMLFVALDLGRLLHLVPVSFLKNSPAGALTVAGAIALLLLGGWIHYHHKYRESLEIGSGKVKGDTVTVVFASDLHIGYHNRAREISRWVDMINAENADLVLFAGDILDGALRPAVEWDYASILRGIKAPVFACPGNHEYIAGKEKALAFLEGAGIRVLADSAAVEAGIRVIGRDDRSNRSRKALQDIAPEDSLFTIVLDHQPYHLEEAEQYGADFQFSGHTHHGQIWPGNWLTGAMYEKAFGEHLRGDTRYYISSGLGIWGGKFRIGTRSEYVVLRIKNSYL